jgi:hypothetical protein
MVTDWIFSSRRGTDKQRDPAWAEFFHSAISIRDNCEALVRESIQNSLDQTIEGAGPLRMTFTYSAGDQVVSASVAAGYFDSLWPHLIAVGLSIPEAPGPCPFLVIEDFNTSGLTGDPRAVSDPPEGETNDFYYFLRAEGKSGKKGPQRGRWGIGKYVFPMSSEIFTFFALTVRPTKSDLGWDEGQGLLLGESVLLNHDVGPAMFMPDGWWGRHDSEDAPVLPLTDHEALTKFRSDWNVSRTTEPGLSVIVPYVDGNWSAQGIVQSVIEDYFVAICEGRLIVNVVDSDSNTTTEISGDSIDRLLSGSSMNGLNRDRIVKDMELVRWAETAVRHRLPLQWQGAPKWRAIDCEEASLEVLREGFSEHGRVLVEIPVEVEKTNGTLKSTCYMDVILEEDQDSRDYPLFIRSGIKVSQAGREKLNGVRGLALIRDANLSQMVGDAENPAHVDWSDQTKAFKDRYKYGSSWLTYIRFAPREILKLIRGAEGENDYSVAADYFPSNEDGRRGGSGQGNRPDEAGGSTDPTVSPGARTPGRPTPKRPDVAIEQLQDGFRLHLTAEGRTRSITGIEGKVAYDVRVGDAFTKWTNDDFSFDGSGFGPRLTVSCSGGIATTMRNEFSLVVDDPRTFKFDVTGFDPNRDIRIQESTT